MLTEDPPLKAAIWTSTADDEADTWSRGTGLADAGAAGKAKGKNAKKAGGGGAGLGKTDYNFEWDPKIYDANDWAGRKAGQPFFMQVQLAGGKLRGGNDTTAQAFAARAKATLGAATDPEKVTLPPKVMVSSEATRRLIILTVPVSVTGPMTSDTLVTPASASALVSREPFPMVMLAVSGI